MVLKQRNIKETTTVLTQSCLDKMISDFDDMLYDAGLEGRNNDDLNDTSSEMTEFVIDDLEDKNIASRNDKQWLEARHDLLLDCYEALEQSYNDGYSKYDADDLADKVIRELLDNNVIFEAQQSYFYE